MKKMLKNQKGFSLIELLIVIAIMGVLAAVAFSMFAGVFGNSQRRADERIGDQIAKAITAYMVDTQDVNLAALNTFGVDITDPEAIITALQDTITVPDPVTNLDKDYGPYLVPKEGSTADYSNFATRWSSHVGYDIQIYSDLVKADCKPVDSTGTVQVVIN